MWYHQCMKHHQSTMGTVILNNVHQLNSCPLAIKHLCVIQLLKPHHVQYITFPYPIFRPSCLQNPIICACQISRNCFCVDDQIPSSEDYRCVMTLDIFLPQDIIGPEEASRDGVSDTHIFRGEVGELVFIGAGWFTPDLRCSGYQ